MSNTKAIAALKKAGMSSEAAARVSRLFNDDEPIAKQVREIKAEFPELFTSEDPKDSKAPKPDPQRSADGRYKAEDGDKDDKSGIVTRQMRALRGAVQSVKDGSYSASSAAAARLIPNDKHERHSNASATSKATADVLRRGVDSD